jgi:hypothetical protein
LAGNKRDNKRVNPNYRQISGYVPLEATRRFKSAYAAEGLDQNEAVEEAILLWLAMKENKTTVLAGHEVS